ncbi:MAG: ATP-binding protein, partial [Oscillospiraceae bacterium]|nr:ATP-binding protein [Oscillospiraceae bacterium]
TPLSCQLWNRDFKVIDCNEEMVRLFGFKNKKDCIDRQQLIYPEFQPDGLRSREVVETYLKNAFSAGFCTLDWVYIMLDGTPMPAEVTLVRIKHNDGDVVAAYSRDLRDEKAAEKKLLESMERENDLEIQRQVAQAASNAKTQFLANMSHEIRTPMNAIIGMSDLLLSESLNARQHRFVEDIKISSNALLDIINDILDFSKIQSSKLILSPIHYELKSLINNISSMVYFLIADRKKIDFEIYIQDELPAYLYGDDVRLRQVLLNLLSNAIKFTRKGSVKLSFLIEESSIDDESTSLLITVADTGTGIPEESIPTLFDAFEQADVQTNRYQQGTGLGLAITKALVERMGGSISVESEYGVGTVFKLLLPLIPGDRELINTDTANAEAGIVYAPEARVLVVDDRETNITVINGLLSQCQIDADSAISGARAIRMAERISYDLIFMDHMMPEMDGVETTKVLRDMGIHIPIIALTANALFGAKEMYLANGFNGFIPKPLDVNELNELLKTFLPPEKIESGAEPKKTSSVPKETAPKEKIEEISPKNSFMDALDSVSEIDKMLGLSRVSNMEDIYQVTVELFNNNLIPECENMSALLDGGNIKDFATAVHAMKSMLSTIGAMELSSKALELEMAAKKEETDFCRNNFPAFLEKLRGLNKGLSSVFETIN